MIDHYYCNTILVMCETKNCNQLATRKYGNIWLCKLCLYLETKAVR